MVVIYNITNFSVQHLYILPLSQYIYAKHPPNNILQVQGIISLQQSMGSEDNVLDCNNKQRHDIIPGAFKATGVWHNDPYNQMVYPYLHWRDFPDGSFWLHRRQGRLPQGREKSGVCKGPLYEGDN